MPDLIRIIKKIRPYTIKKGFLYLRHYGLKEFMIRLKERTEPEVVPYGPWYEKHKADDATLRKQAAESKNAPVKISVAVPAYKTDDVFRCVFYAEQGQFVFHVKPPTGQDTALSSMPSSLLR